MLSLLNRLAVFSEMSGMIFPILFYCLVVLFVLTLIGCWISNLIGLPGNWMMLVACAIWFWIIDPDSIWHIDWQLLIVFAVLASIGELIEFAASVLGTHRAGGSRRAAVWSVVGSVVGGIMGGLFGLPIAIPLVGMVIGSLLFASLGAMVGAMLGESSEGSEFNKNMKVGGAAFAGRFVGTVAKIALGSAILVISIFALFF